MSKNSNKPVSPSQTQKAANESAGAKAQKVSDNDILKEAAKTAEPAKTAAAEVQNAPGPDTKTAQDAADVVPGETIAAGETAAETGNVAPAETAPAADKVEPAAENADGPPAEERTALKSAADQEAEGLHTKARALYLSSFSKEAPEDMSTEDMEAAVEQEIQRQKAELDKKATAKGAAAEALHKKRLKKFGKGYVEAEKNGTKTVFTALAWRNMGENREGWRQVVEVPDEIKGKSK